MFRLLLSVLLGTLLCTTALATTTLTYQGRLDQQDVPLTGDIAMRFQLFDSASGGMAIGPTLAQVVLVDDGLFSVDLDFGDQAYQDGLWLEVEVDGELLSPRQRLAAAPLAIRSLDGTGLQAGLDALLQRVTALEAANVQLRSQLDALALENSVQESDINTLQGAVADANAEIAQLQSITAAQSATIVSLDGRLASLEFKTQAISAVGTDLFIDGMNVHVRSGSGSTSATPNGRGNLIIGYNEPKTTAPVSVRTGSHNLVLGQRNSYTSYGGIVGGVENRIGGAHASVISGESNQSTGEQSVVVSGFGGLADDTTSVVLSGFGNRATGFRAAVISGWQNDAQGSYSAILGGDTNTTTATESSIGGGDNVAVTNSSKFTAEGEINP